METLDDILKPIEQEASLYSENVSTENIKTDNLESTKLETIRTVGANIVRCGAKKRLVTQAGEQGRNALLISKLKFRFERSHVQRNRFLRKPPNILIKHNRKSKNVIISEILFLHFN